MSEANKATVRCWFTEFWGNPWNENIVDELGTLDILVHYPMHVPRQGRDVVKKMMWEFRAAFPDLNFQGVGELIAEGDYVVGRREEAVPILGQRSMNLPIGALPAASGRTMRFTGTTVFRLENGKIA